MGIFFSGSELINIAIGIERNGAVFYDSLAEATSNPTIHRAYTYLADKEREHLEIFQDMLQNVGDYQSPETLTEEYDAYLKTLVNSLLFTDDKVAREIAQKVSSDAEAIQIALGAEKDSILIYSEMQHLVRKPDYDIVNGIIEEEKSHMRQLVDLKENLSTLQ